MAERQERPLDLGELSITSTKEMESIEAGENFLGSDPEDVSLVKKKVKDDKKDKKEVKEVVEVPREIDEDNFFSAFEPEDDEEEDEEDEEESEEEKKEIVSKKSQKKSPGQNIQEEAAKPIEENQEDSKEEDQTNVFSTVAKELFQHGIFSLDEGEDEEVVEKISTGEDLLNRLQSEAVKQARFTIDKFIGRFGEDYQRMFENVFIHGVHPSDYLAKHNKIEDIASLDVEDESSQERIVRELLRSENRSAEYIEKAVSRMRQYGDLADEAKEAQRILIEKQEEAIEQAKAEKANEQARKQQMRSEYLENVNQILSEKIKSREYDGIPVDRKFAEQTFNYITRERYQTPTGQLLTEFDKDILDLNRPDKHDLKVKMAMLLQMVKADPTLSKLAKRAVSKESNGLFQGLQKTAMKTKSSTKTKENEEPVSWFSKDK
jgi:hypothetical protein